MEELYNLLNERLAGWTITVAENGNGRYNVGVLNISCPGPWLSSRKAEESAGDGRLLELLLILPENARRRTADTAGTVAEFKNL
ncbi:hypothetical protein pipiens_007409 [Culex pipiens pipiens]|uniref:Uncharacterized protein n=1 Tax=Culex pipiens pipiens TaxID=38569 RepID=A0ABD1DLP6_CULPP